MARCNGRQNTSAGQSFTGIRPPTQLTLAGDIPSMLGTVQALPGLRRGILG